MFGRHIYLKALNFSAEVQLFNMFKVRNNHFDKETDSWFVPILLDECYENTQEVSWPVGIRPGSGTHSSNQIVVLGDIAIPII